jgi:hypothetical protein
MSRTNGQFWQYAKEAILSACEANTEKDKKGLLELARTWTQAALQERASANRSRQTGWGQRSTAFRWTT